MSVVNDIQLDPESANEWGFRLMRLLIVDDEAALHDAYRHALAAAVNGDATDALQQMARSLFAEPGADLAAADAAEMPAEPEFDCSCATQGLDGVALVEQSLIDRQPYKVAFIDVRMPPGIDGKETARRIRALDANINIVIVSAYSDHGVTEIARVAGPADKLFYISKPFTAEEVRQMATALAKRWDVDALLQQKMAELAASEARANHIAEHDFLTGAPNRRAFQRELGRRLKEHPDDVGLVLLDLDRFKHVNDTFGHAAGDELISSVYARLREVAPSDAMIARLGGDEFGLIFEAAEASAIDAVCRKALASCAANFSVHGCEIDLTSSAGYVRSGDHRSRDAVELVRYADIALYAAKHKGRNRACRFDTEMDESAKFRHLVESGLRQAIARDELSLLYQPIVDRNSLNIVGFEALLRWNSQEHGDISPQVFVPIAEEGPLIQEIGDWVMDKAIAESRNWQQHYVSINLSVRQLGRADLVERLCQLAARHGASHDNIQLEVTETALFENAALAATKLQTLRGLGFRIALDDFGTGYSTMFNIKNFAIDCIKIDKSFIDDLGNDNQSAAIVGSITHLARTLGLTVVAEGVETDLQAQALRVSGCSHLQGYLFGRPRSALHTRQLVQDTDFAADRAANG